MARLQTTVESLTVIDGVRQERTWNARAVEPSAASTQAIAKGSLYILLELGGEAPASPRLFRLLMNTVQGVYYDAGGGIKGGITEAIVACHQALQQHNTVHPEEEQLGGVSCAVLRGEELYLGVGGPAMVLVGNETKVDLFPAELSPSARPLGAPEAPTIEIFRTTVEEDTLVVQLASEWVARVPTRKLAVTALAPDLPAALEYLEGLAPAKAALSALAVRVTPDGEEPDADADQPAAAGAAALAAVEEEALEDEAEAMVEGSQVPAEVAQQARVETTTPPAAKPEPERSLVATAPAPSPEQATTGRRRWWLLLLLLPVILIALVAAALWWQQRNLQMEYGSLIQGAEAALQAATAADVPEGTAISQLQTAEEQVAQAVALVPDDPRGLELQQTIRTQLDEVYQVVPLYKLVTMLPLGGAGSEPARLVIQGSRAYLLDQGLDRVVRYDIDEASGLVPETEGVLVAQRGQTLPDGQLVGELVDMTWAEAGGLRNSSNLLILDSNGNLLEADPATGLRPLAVAGREEWTSPPNAIISSYNGNFYLLDRGTGRILRYRPSEDGYSNPPEDYLEGDVTLDLSRAVDMAIDGNIWVLYRDGTVQTFLQGLQQAFELQPPPNGPLTRPESIYVGSAAGTAQSFFISDSGDGRIVEYDKEGNYLRQYRPVDSVDVEKLRKMSDLEVSEVDRVFYILGEDGLYRTDIP